MKVFYIYCFKKGLSCVVKSRRQAAFLSFTRLLHNLEILNIIICEILFDKSGSKMTYFSFGPQIKVERPLARPGTLPIPQKMVTAIWFEVE